MWLWRGSAPWRGGGHRHGHGLRSFGAPRALPHDGCRPGGPPSRPRPPAPRGPGPCAPLVNRLRGHMEQVIGAVLLGNNMVNIFASALATSLLIGLFGERGVAYATGVMTVLIVVFAEVLPKTYAINNADKLALGVAGPMNAVVSILRPLIRVMQLFVRGILRLCGANVTTDLGADKAEEEL